MLGNIRKNSKKASAYTLAEMLIVMTIIVLLFLAMPPMTKKLFKQDVTRKIHGRYECYWERNAAGTATLKARMIDEYGTVTDGITVAATSSMPAHCQFKPPQNVIFFIINAVGGGGGGASLNKTSRTRKTKDKEEVSAISYLYKSNPSVWPAWVTLFSKSHANDLPWKNNYGYKDHIKHNFDVFRLFTRQYMRYRMGGTAGKVVTSFVPKLADNVTLLIAPGKGGDILASGSRNSTNINDEKGKNGENTVIYYKYGSSSPVVSLTAYGGTGGDNIQAETSTMLLGQTNGDLGTGNYASVRGSGSGFYDLILESDREHTDSTKIPKDAGDGGNGETMYIEDTTGISLYQWNNYASFNPFPKRHGSNWVNFTKIVGNTDNEIKVFYDNLGIDANCKLATLTSGSKTIIREGDCDLSSDKTKYTCKLGKENTTGAFVTFTYSNALHNWEHMPTTYSADFGSCSGSSCPYYSCTFRPASSDVSCYTKIATGRPDVTQGSPDALHYHNCPAKNTLPDDKRCVSGKKNSNNQPNEYYTCAPSRGGDGAVVILW